MLFCNRDTRIDLTGASMAAVRHVQQAIEVWFGEIVELQHLPIVLSPTAKDEVRGRKCLRRGVVVKGEFILYPSNAHFKFEGEFEFVKDQRECVVTRWEIREGDAYLKVVDDGNNWKELSAHWTYSAGLYPEVDVVQSRGGFVKNDGKFQASWNERGPRKIGRDRSERREEPFFPQLIPAESGQAS